MPREHGLFFSWFTEVQYPNWVSFLQHGETWAGPPDGLVLFTSVDAIKLIPFTMGLVLSDWGCLERMNVDLDNPSLSCNNRRLNVVALASSFKGDQRVTWICLRPVFAPQGLFLHEGIKNERHPFLGKHWSEEREFKIKDPELEIRILQKQ